MNNQVPFLSAADYPSLDGLTACCVVVVSSTNILLFVPQVKGSEKNIAQLPPHASCLVHCCHCPLLRLCLRSTTEHATSVQKLCFITGSAPSGERLRRACGHSAGMRLRSGHRPLRPPRGTPYDHRRCVCSRTTLEDDPEIYL